jgi:hypothetical protein
MKSDRNTAVIVGILYILGTVSGVLSVLTTQSILTYPVDLLKINANANQVMVGGLFILAMGFSLAPIPFLMFPILKKQNEPLAIGYVVFRGALETLTYMAAALSWMVLIVISREYTAGMPAAGIPTSGTPAAAILQTLGNIGLKGQESMTTMTVFAFSLGALMFYSLLFQTRLIPRWLSVWGWIAIAMHLATAFLGMFGLAAVSTDSPITLVLNTPIFFQEMVMAVWMIAKGFDAAPLAVRQVKTNPGLIS